MDQPLVIHWFYVGLAIALLWFPRQWMRFGKLRRKSRKERETMEKFAQDGARDPNDQSLRLGRELKALRNYLDFFRGIVGGIALWDWSFTGGEQHNTTMLVAKIAIMVTGVMIATLRWRDRITWFAAVFYFAGISIGMGNYVSGSLAFLLICAINPVIATPRLFVAAYGFLLLPFNYFLGGGLTPAVVNCSIVFLPVLGSLLTHRQMVVFTRKRNLMW